MSAASFIAPPRAQVHAQGLKSAAMLAGVALAYWVSGRIGLLLAIPPGYATAVWPPSGIALAAVLLLGPRAAWGVMLGSFMVNIGNNFDADTLPQFLHAAMVPGVIAAGAAAQALLGGWLIQHFIGYRNVLEQELEVAWMLLLGGPLACLLNASVGVATLWSLGAIANSAAFSSWTTWWVGDSIGVLIFAPLVLVWALRPHQLWLQRKLYATAPLAGLFALVVLAFFLTSKRETARIEQQFHTDASGFITGVQDEMSDFTGLVNSLRGLFESSSEVTADEFRRFAALTQAQTPALAFMGWAPLVDDAQRAGFEAQQRASRPQFHLQELAGEGARSLREAAPRERYAPVMAAWPEVNTGAYGFDLYSDPVRAGALRRATATGQISLTDPLHLMYDPEGRVGMLMVAPVTGGADGQKGLSGFVTAALRAPDMFAQAVHDLESRGLAVDMTAAGPDADVAGGVVYRSPHWHAPIKGDLAWKQTMTVVGRQWTASFVLPAQYLVEHRSLETWMVLTAGMAFTGLFGIFVLVMIGRTSRIEQLVGERTSDLAREMMRAEALERDARHQADRLAASNRDLEQFAYVASHDLQAPLRTIASFAGLLEARYARSLDAKGQDFLDAIVEGAQEMKSRIRDLLELSRVNSERAEMQAVNLDDVFEAVSRQMAKDIADSGAQITRMALPNVHGDRKMLEQLFQNLISNALKFQKGGQQPRLDIRATAAHGTWRIAFCDNGIGISKGSLREIFVMFRRLHAADKFSGTGIGLAICKKIVDLHHGSIEVQSELGQGSAFTVILPMAASH